jgi:hypothetical protein
MSTRAISKSGDAIRAISVALGFSQKREKSLDILLRSQLNGHSEADS